MVGIDRAAKKEIKRKERKERKKEKKKKKKRGREGGGGGKTLVERGRAHEPDPPRFVSPHSSSPREFCKLTLTYTAIVHPPSSPHSLGIARACTRDARSYRRCGEGCWIRTRRIPTTTLASRASSATTTLGAEPLRPFLHPFGHLRVLLCFVYQA